VKSSYIRDIITALLRYKNTKRKTRSAVPKFGDPGTLRVINNFLSSWIIIAVNSINHKFEKYTITPNRTRADRSFYYAN